MYMLYVEGRGNPKVEHEFKEDAEIEAERLAMLPENIGRQVYLLEAKKVCWTDIPVYWREV